MHLLLAWHHGEHTTHRGQTFLQNAEIFTLTYGSIVRQLITDLDDIDLVNKQLDAM